MRPTNLTLKELERWAYAENDQRQLAKLYTTGDLELLRARAEAMVHLEETKGKPQERNA